MQWGRLQWVTTVLREGLAWVPIKTWGTRRSTHLLATDKSNHHYLGTK